MELVGATWSELSGKDSSRIYGGVFSKTVLLLTYDRRPMVYTTFFYSMIKSS